MNRTHRGTLFLGLAAWVVLAWLVSCSAAEDVPNGHVENAPGRHRQVPTGSGYPRLSSSTATAAASASIPPTADPRDRQTAPCFTAEPRPTSPPFVDEPPSGQAPPGGPPMPPPPRALSQNVPDRACRADSECGDGFCDRGRCAPIWEDRYGQRCAMDCQCGPYLCLEGRCRSCLRHAECSGMGGVCGIGRLSPSFAYACGALGMHQRKLPPEPVRPPPPPTP